MHVRMFPKPHIFANLDGPGYFGDRITFAATDDRYLFYGEEYPPGPRPDHILGIPLGTYRRCNAGLVRSIEKKLATVEGEKGDIGRVVDIRSLLACVREHIDQPPDVL